MAHEEPVNPFQQLTTDADHDVLIPAQIPTIHRTSSFTFEGLAGPILLHEDASGGCGGKTWEAANIMCDHLIWKHAQTDGELFRGKTVLELGAGTGLVGLMVGKLCREEVTKIIITDQMCVYQSPMLELMEANLRLNKLESCIDVKELNWQVLSLAISMGEPTQSMIPFVPDIILASDCVYLEAAFEPLVITLADLATLDTTIFLSYRKRRKADKRFFNILKKRFDFVEVS
ncbi:putative methyltransferase-domain-containing protein [Jimgerdemannia flammicorona]|uniref:Putative methyltransferase-domain-containing protein n=1 Tax=Jimgerdemannia flammicorona TaxID=994334 RepID=A0A433QDZ2_9FUNG|nr:putative methyltransferase-domain-containing protein [Jimgerdemannia flammicorona]